MGDSDRQTSAPPNGDSSYLSFWNSVGREFPDLTDAESTAYYREDEKRLFRDYLNGHPGLRVLKTDLWDEAKNTRILRWAAQRGICPFGLDISLPIVLDAKRSFSQVGLALHGVVADVREIPFREGSFDAVYSMGTIEHFDGTEHAVDEIFLSLRPGGRAIVGVPNRRDPFLRPLMVAVLYRLGLYGYGFEKSYSAATLRKMLEHSGFRVSALTGILFIPGWLRMADLALHVWARPLARMTGLCVKPFAYLSRRFAALRRHGYLIAAVGERPAGVPDGRPSSVGS